MVLPTDKSGRFGVMSQDNYYRAGEKHVKKDEEILDEAVLLKPKPK